MSADASPRTFRAFERLSPLAKSLWIAALCAVLGVLSGFALYLTFAKLLNEANAQARLLALFIGLLIALAVSFFIDWLREAIASGKTEVAWPSWRALLPVVVVLAVFELAITIVNDTAKDIIVEYNAIKTIASRIAGQDVSTLGPDRDMAALDARLSSFVAQSGLPEAGAAPAASIDGRILQAMPLRPRLLLYAGLEGGRGIIGRQMSEAQILALHRDLLRDPPFHDAARAEEAEGAQSSGFDLVLGRVPRWIQRCSAEGIGNGDAAARAACRTAVQEIGAADRQLELWAAMVHVFARRDLYHPVSFAGAKLEPSVVQTTESKLCAAPGPARPAWCPRPKGPDGRRAAEPAPLSALEVARLNHELLVAADVPGFKPLRSFWPAFWLLIAIWCVAAVSLAGILVIAIFQADRFVDGPEALSDRFFLGVLAVIVTGVGAAVVVAAVRAVPYAWSLIVSPCSLDGRALPRGDPRALLDLLPLLVYGLARCTAPAASLFVPGWLSTGALVAGLVALRARLAPRIPERHRRWAVPLGWLLIPVAFAGPLVSDRLLELAQVVALTWLIPALGFALLLPYLKPASRMPKLWAGVAFLVAILLLGWTWLRLADLDTLELTFLVVATAVALAIGAMILSETTMGELWPVLAMTLALAAVGISGQLSTTFSTALDSLSVMSDRAAKSLPAHLEHLHPERASPIPPEPATSAGASLPGHPTADSSPEPRVVEPPPPEDLRPYLPTPPLTGTTDRRQAVRLELSLVGALSFWLTLGLLVCWRLRDQSAAIAAPEPAQP